MNIKQMKGTWDSCAPGLDSASHNGFFVNKSIY